MIIWLHKHVRSVAARLLAAGSAVSFALMPGVRAEVPTVTLTLIPEAPVTLVRGTSTFVVEAPLSLHPGDLISTALTAGGARLEDSAGTVAALGPQTRLAVNPWPRPRRHGKPDPESLALLSGWLKVSHDDTKSINTIGVDTPALLVRTEDGAVVIHASSNETALFVETGHASTRPPDGSTQPMIVDNNAFLRRTLGQAMHEPSRPDAEFIRQLPLTFRDPLGVLPKRAPTHEPGATEAHQTTYGDVADWLTTRLPIRRTFVSRFQVLARREPFRSLVRSELKALPEWRKVLYPPHLPEPQRPSSTPPAEDSI